jgi:hypothetical protein
MKCESCGMKIRGDAIITRSSESDHYYCCVGCRDDYRCKRDEALRRLWKTVRY